MLKSSKILRKIKISLKDRLSAKQHADKDKISIGTKATRIKRRKTEAVLKITEWHIKRHLQKKYHTDYHPRI